MNINPYDYPKTTGLSAVPKPSTHGKAIVVSLAQQTFILLLAALVLDGGRLLRAFSGALIVSWGISLVVMLRRRDHPTTFDLVVIKYGFWFVIVLLLLLRLSTGLAIIGV